MNEISKIEDIKVVNTKLMRELGILDWMIYTKYDVKTLKRIDVDVPYIYLSHEKLNLVFNYLKNKNTIKNG